jgi:LAO/AO transport system kinase
VTFACETLRNLAHGGAAVQTERMSQVTPQVTSQVTSHAAPHRIPDLAALRGGGKRALSQALTLVETARGSRDLARLLDAATAEPRAHVLGLTGPPGVGKSTLTNALLRDWRTVGESVGVIAVDPSSRASGGALLGDRARIATDPNDRDVFVRSMAARDRLGGLSDDTVAAVVLMRALFDRVLVESVGIGQSEADISFVADTVVLCIQPGSGDSLQFMKAGVMELPDIIVVTKADAGPQARRAASEVEGALGLFARSDSWTPPVLLVSAAQGTGLDALRDTIAAHRAHLGASRLAARRRMQESVWIEQTLRARFGSEGLLAAPPFDPAAGGPFTRMDAASAALRARLALDHSGTNAGPPPVTKPQA